MLNELNFSYGRPKASGQIKSRPEDFCVIENLGFELTGEGEHLFLLIQKKRLNTEEMVKIIARAFSLPFKSISYAGLKDKFAETTQWFSLHLPGMSDPKLGDFKSDNYCVLKAVRHNKKLKIGALKENHFMIKINEFKGDEAEFAARIEEIKTHGVPNYFGPQRFGNNSSNLLHAKSILLEHKKIKNRHLRGIYYSAARSFLFNQIVSYRVGHSTWNQPLPGDLMMLSGSHSVFQIDTVNAEIIQRTQENDISPSAALWGIGHDKLTKDALQCQNIAIDPWQDWCLALEQHQLQRCYRSMVLLPNHLQFQDNILMFTLPAGTYATTVLRELLVSELLTP